MTARIVALALIGALAYILQGLDGEQAIFMAALPLVAALSIFLLGNA